MKILVIACLVLSTGFISCEKKPQYWEPPKVHIPDIPSVNPEPEPESESEPEPTTAYMTCGCCGGSGVCQGCYGTGQIYSVFDGDDVVDGRMIDCSACGGSGACGNCNGSGVIEYTKYF